ncbi:MAG: ferrous iron transporter B [Thermodesulfobacteriota bacterium]
MKETINRKRHAIAIVGNMNVGKSTLFSRMCGKSATSVNIAGTTVSINRGRIKEADMDAFDTPGICSIFSPNEDERISRDVLLPQEGEHDIQGVIVVADAKNMKRSIAIVIQYAEYGLPMLLDVNMIDEAASHGIEIDYEKLSEVLGIDVCTSIASDGIGVQRIISKLAGMRVSKKLVKYPGWVEQFLEMVEKMLKSSDVPPRVIGLLLLARDSSIMEYVERNFGTGMLEQLKDLAEEYSKEGRVECSILLTNLYNKRAEQIVREIQKVETPSKNPYLVTFGDWCTKLSTGIPIAMVILLAMYLFIGSFGATFLVDTINGTLFEGLLIPWVNKLVEPINSSFIRDMLIDPSFGVLPTGVFLALGLVLPVIFCFYIAFGFLQDSGYLPRISLLLDKVFQKMGLNGKGVVPLLMGFSCITMAILTTRILNTEKEKNIASFLVFLALPCAPLLSVMLIILKKMPVSASFTVFGLIFSQLLIAGFLANKVLPGVRSPLFLEIPPMRLPDPLQVLKMSASKTYFFMKEALPVFIFASAGVFLFQRAGGLEILERETGPLISNLMGLPEKSIQVFIKTMIRRECGAAELKHLSGMYSNLQLVVNLVVMTFVVPCVNAIIVLLKERGLRAAAAILVAVMIYAALLGSIVNHACRFLGITFA